MRLNRIEYGPNQQKYDEKGGCLRMLRPFISERSPADDGKKGRQRAGVRTMG